MELIDAELGEDEEYLSLGDGAAMRVKQLLGVLNEEKSNREAKRSVSNRAREITGKFTRKVKSIFDSLPKPIEWDSFRRHDLPLVTDLPADVREVAIANKLNKSQTKALSELAQKAPNSYRLLTEVTNVIDTVGLPVILPVESQGG